jgi:ankyrin repeat protein
MILMLIAAWMVLVSPAQSAIHSRSTKIIDQQNIHAKHHVIRKPRISKLSNSRSSNFKSKVARLSTVHQAERLIPSDHPILNAIEKDRSAELIQWLKQGNSANTRIQHKVKESLLERAAVNGSIESFRVLLSRLKSERIVSSKVGRDHRGTPLILILSTLAVPEKANSSRYLGMIDLILKSYPDQVGWKDQAYIGDGRTALHQAAANGNVQLIKILLRHGAHIDSVNSTGESPLHFAARFGRLNALKTLIDHGAKIDHKTKHTQATPLLIAAENGYESIIRELLDRGAKKESKDVFGKTPPERYREYVASYQKRIKNRSSN